MSAPASAKTTDTNLALAKAMGSKRGYDPMPPDQHEWQRAEGEPPLYRLWSWMCGHTIRQGHRSAFAVDERGKAVALKDAARELKIDLGQISNLWTLGESEGIWHRNGGRELYLNGAVDPAKITEANKKRQVECTLNLGRAELLKIKSWPKTRQEEFYAVWNPAQEYRAKLAAAAIAQARETCDGMDDSILRRFSLEKKRLPKRRPAEPPLPQSLFEFVHSTNVPSISLERTDGEETGENVSVQQPPSLLTSENTFREDLRSVGQLLGSKEDRPTDPIPFPTDVKPEDTRIDAVYMLLCAELPHLHEDPSRSLCLQVLDGLKGAPLEHLQALIQRKRGKIASLGLCRDLAQEAGRAWQREAGARQRLTEAKAAHDARGIEQGRRFAQETLDDPRAGPDEKELARDILATKIAGGRG
jgi:hypothetical protein